MSVPEHLWRFPTRAAIDALAERFTLPNTPDMQDWAWEVADPCRIDEFLAAYQSSELTDDERFTLMEIILQSFADASGSLSDDTRWSLTLSLLDKNVALHIYSIWYWSDLENDLGEEDQWKVTPFLRKLLDHHSKQFAQ